MRGQLTLEYMLLAVLALALISISLAALVKIREAGDKAYRLELFKSSAMDIYNAGEEVCAMGSGSSLRIRVRESVSISEEGGQAAFSSKELNSSFSKNTKCGYAPSSAEPGEAVVANQEGEITLR